MHLLSKLARPLINQIYIPFFYNTQGGPQNRWYQTPRWWNFSYLLLGQITRWLQVSGKKHQNSIKFLYTRLLYILTRAFSFFFSSEVCGTDPPFSCPIHVFDGQDDVKHNLEGIIFCLFFKITNKDVITINYTFYSRLHLFSQSLILCALFYIFGNAKSISVLVTV